MIIIAVIVIVIILLLLFMFWETITTKVKGFVTKQPGYDCDGTYATDPNKLKMFVHENTQSVIRILYFNHNTNLYTINQTFQRNTIMNSLNFLLSNGDINQQQYECALYQIRTKGI